MEEEVSEAIGPPLMRPEGRRLSGYECLKVVGKGAFGTALLFRRLRDDLLVVIKEINLLDLNGRERQMARNEVKVLSTLQHPHIIKYFDSFEEDSVLMIEMEYADGGTLHQYLSRLDRPMEERAVLDIFGQIARAILYMHENHVLHRDLKTSNIFLMRDQSIKIGDFGISKMTQTRAVGANTVVGTPYYISPEMCKGQSYDGKSDVWALGCVLYEMVCLHRTFEGTNLPALVHKIMKGQFDPIRGNYSREFRQLVQDLLQQEPTFRPSAWDIVHRRLPVLVEQCKSRLASSGSPTFGGKDGPNATTVRQPRSVLFRLQFDGGAVVAVIPIAFPPQHLIQQVSTSDTHSVALTSEGLVYGWGCNAKGQLGLDPKVLRVEKPTRVGGLKGKTVTQVGSGNGFSVFSCSNGILMTCGDGASGCLGHGDWKSVPKPKIIEKLLSVDITAIACGPHHVVVVGGKRWAFSWGCGSDGRLGHGAEMDTCSPVEIKFSEVVDVREVRCGVDATMFLTAGGQAWACGSNSHNKLGLDSRARFWWTNKGQLRRQLCPTRLSHVLKVVVDASLGLSHSALLLENGQVVTFGLNHCGQLTDRATPVVHSLKNHRVHVLLCGDTFTLVGTLDNALYWWGCQPGSTQLEVRQRPSECRRHGSLVWDVPAVEETAPSPSTDTGPSDSPCEVNGDGIVPFEGRATKPRQILMYVIKRD